MPIVMRFLTQRPVLRLSDDGGKYTSFFADVAPRPSFDDIVGFVDAAANLTKCMAGVVARKANPISSAALVIDGIGVCLLISTSKRIQVQNARSAVDTMLAALPVAERLSVEKSIRPLDELDKCRIDDWFLASPLKQYREPTTVAPAAAARDTTVSTRDFVSMYSEDVSSWFFKKGESRPAFPEPEPAPTVRALLDAASDSEDDAPAAMLTDAAPAAPLMLTDAAIDGVVAIAGHPAACAEVWKDGLKSMAVVVVGSVGALDELTFVRCHSENRRIALLLRSLSGKQNLVDVVRVALRLSRDGSLPPFDAARNRKAEFLKRCAEALAKHDPSAIREPKKLDDRQQRLLALALDARLCVACSKSPGIYNGNDLLFDWVCTALIDVPEVVGDLLCAVCASKRLLFCPKCGKSDSLQVERDDRFLACIDWGIATVAFNTRCTRCSCSAWVAPAAKRRRMV